MKGEVCNEVPNKQVFKELCVHVSWKYIPIAHLVILLLS